MKNLLETDPRNSMLTIQRALLGAVMFPHGAQKLLGWFGGYGFDGTMKFLTDTIHVPAPLALLVILGESLGALLLIAGLGMRVAAFGISASMLGAILTTHASVGFFMNWFGNQPGEGYVHGRGGAARSVEIGRQRPHLAAGTTARNAAVAAHHPTAVAHGGRSGRV